MPKMRALSAILLLVVLSLLLPECLLAQPRPRKKIIEYGWDVPYPDFVRDNIREMEKRPFEGIIFRTNGFDHAFDVRPWNQADLQPQLETLAQIQWQRFTDNFLTLYAANKWKMDWFNDDQWKVITENMKLFSLAVHSGKCVGVCFDPEPYGDDPWVYPGQYKDNRSTRSPTGAPSGPAVHRRLAGAHAATEGPELLPVGSLPRHRR